MSGLPSLYPDKDEKSEWEEEIKWCRKQYEESCRVRDASGPPPPPPKTPRIFEATAFVIGKIDEIIKKVKKCSIVQYCLVLYSLYRKTLMRSVALLGMNCMRVDQ